MAKKIINKKISAELLHIMYNTDDILTDEKGNKIEVPPEGSLGILALGYRGLIAWRKAKGITYDKNRKINTEKKSNEKK